MAKKNKEVRYYGTGRRKSSIARVYLVPGKGSITVNGRDVNEYMPYATLVMDLKQPLELTSNADKFDVVCNVNGGGFTGQAGAFLLKKYTNLQFYQYHNLQPINILQNLKDIIDTLQ